MNEDLKMAEITGYLNATNHYLNINQSTDGYTYLDFVKLSKREIEEQFFLKKNHKKEDRYTFLESKTSKNLLIQLISIPLFNGSPNDYGKWRPHSICEDLADLIIGLLGTNAGTTTVYENGYFIGIIFQIYESYFILEWGNGD